MSIENQVKGEMQTVEDHCKMELKALRTGRAHIGLVDQVMVEVYGTHMRLKDLASITIPESRQILITPFDPKNASVVSKAIEAANLNLQAVAEGNVVRILVPPMDESIRKKIAQQCRKKGEESKVSIREVRRKYNDLARKQKSTGEITEDLLKKYEKVIQEMTDKFCKDIDTLCTVKEKEILEV